MTHPLRNEIYMFGFRGFPGVQGGIETHAEHLAPQLVQLGHDVTVCFRSPYVGAECGGGWKGVKLLRLWTVRSTYFEAILHSLLCVLVAGFYRPKVVHVHGVGPALVTPLLRLLGLRVVVTHHGEDYNREKWGWAARTILKTGEAMGMRFANKRIAISRTIESLVAAKYGKNCDVIPNGVVLPDIPTRTDRIAALGLEPGRYVLSVGRLVPEKRQLDLLRAFVSAGLKGWKLVIAGKIDHQNKYADMLVAEAAMYDNVIMAGFHSGEALQQLYAHAGLFVLPSSHEGLPLALLEALSYGVPVLVSDIPSNLEVVDQPAHVFRVGNIEDLKERMAALACAQWDVAERDARRRENIRRYDWTDIAARTSAAYVELMGAGQADAGLRPAGTAVTGTAVTAGLANTIWNELWRSFRHTRHRVP